MEDDQEIGAYLFRRTVPSMHLTPEDVRWMVGSWFLFVTQKKKIKTNILVRTLVLYLSFMAKPWKILYFLEVTYNFFKKIHGNYSVIQNSVLSAITKKTLIPTIYNIQSGALIEKKRTATGFYMIFGL